MLAIFQTMVDLFGHPGDSYEEWINFIHRHRDILTDEEFQKAESWLVLWSPSLQSHLIQLKFGHHS